MLWLAHFPHLTASKPFIQNPFSSVSQLQVPRCVVWSSCFRTPVQARRLPCSWGESSKRCHSPWSSQRDRHALVAIHSAAAGETSLPSRPSSGIGGGSFRTNDGHSGCRCCVEGNFWNSRSQFNRGTPSIYFMCSRASLIHCTTSNITAWEANSPIGKNCIIV